jgi:hypothetical protein
MKLVRHQTVANILKCHGMATAPERGKKLVWKEFIRSHLETLAAADFFTTEVWTAGGLMTYYVLVFMRRPGREFLTVVDIYCTIEIQSSARHLTIFCDRQAGDRVSEFGCRRTFWRPSFCATDAVYPV